MGHIYDLCKGKNICEGGDEMDKKKDEGDDYQVYSYYQHIRLTDYNKIRKEEVFSFAVVQK